MFIAPRGDSPRDSRSPLLCRGGAPRATLGRSDPPKEAARPRRSPGGPEARDWRSGGQRGGAMTDQPPEEGDAGAEGREEFGETG
jgi:hypothetical protein